MKQSELNFTVILDENNVPQSIQWRSTGDAAQASEPQGAHALSVSTWNKDEGGTMRVGLWTKDMPAEQMLRFCVDIIAGIGDDLARATGNTDLAERIHIFADELLQPGAPAPTSAS